MPGTPVRPKDFALVKKDGIFHVFYILNVAGATNPNNELQLGHATSPDLYHWTQWPPVLHVSPGSWVNSHIWAPCIVQRDSVWTMFFAGTTLIPGEYADTQRMGIATSTNLFDWTLDETPVFAATQVPWTWVDSLNSLPAFRDPFVMPDPSTPGSWLMYYTASYGPDSLADVVGVARSDGDFTTWTDAGPLLETWRGYTYNQVTESPHLLFHGGLWYLFVTTSSGQPLTLYTSPDPLGPPSAWTYRGRLRNLLGLDTSTWAASEYLRDGTHDLYAFANGDRLEFREMEWGSGWGFSLLDPPYFHVTALQWMSPSVTTADTARLVVQTANFASGPPHLRTFTVDSLGAETEVPAESLGFEPRPVLATDADTLRWLPVRWPRVPATDTLTVTLLRVRTSDSTAASGLLAVRAFVVRDTSSHSGGEGPGPGIELPYDPPIKPVLHTVCAPPDGNAADAVVQLNVASEGRLELYDLAGRRVRTLADGRLARGVTVIPWDGRDASGVRQPRGVYFARLAVGREVRTARMLLLAR